MHPPPPLWSITSLIYNISLQSIQLSPAINETYRIFTLMIDSVTTSPLQEGTDKNSALQEQLLSDMLIWGLPISHPAEIPTVRILLSLCSNKCNIWTTGWWRSELKVWVHFTGVWRMYPMCLHVCVCAPARSGEYKEKPSLLYGSDGTCIL